MKKLIVLLTVIFSLVLIGATTFTSSLVNEFNDLEKLVVENLQFVENGVKVRCELDGNVELEYKRLEKQILKNYSLPISKENNRLRVEDEKIKIEAIIWEEDGKTIAEISLINNQKDKSISQVKQEITKLLNNNVEKTIYFTFVKGKIDSTRENYIKDILNKTIKNNNLDVLDINNGLAITGYLRNNERINLGYVGYDTGQYLIIGTPTIFVTY